MIAVLVTFHRWWALASHNNVIKMNIEWVSSQEHLPPQQYSRTKKLKINVAACEEEVRA
jgi:hypothetical protein